MRAATHLTQRHYCRSGIRFQTSLIPPPTWSIASLGLEQQHDTAAVDMEALCRRACLVHDDPKLQKQNVANMMHMMEHVVTAAASLHDVSTEECYDRPRGVTADTVVCSSSDREENDESMEWLDTLKTTKMKRVGGHYYFEMDTSKD